MENEIIIDVMINASVEKVWNFYTDPIHIVNWNAASDDWHTTKSENDLRIGKGFSSRMEAKDGSFGFDFKGIYTAIKLNELLEYFIDGDDRKVKVEFHSFNSKTKVIISFEPEHVNSIDRQRFGWQSILNNFKDYVEKN